MLALGFVKCWLDGWVDSVFGLGLGQSCGLTKVGVPLLQTVVGLGWGVFMLVGMCLPYVVAWCDVMCWLCGWVGCVLGDFGVWHALG